ncbi:uncharacterized protein LOC135168558 [Diachasmimorpha longicaudata]|uniref:uncharacterized protein LOC135168558 n=1 Tax=Diachasmimorpha longicaudata TaxID=58733 RepID=UPI0030B8DCFB
MSQISCWSSLLVLLVLACGIHNAESCSCKTEHIHTQYCKAEWVAIMTIQDIINEGKYVNYPVTVRAVSKDPAGVLTKGTAVLMSLPACTVPMMVNETWLLGGKSHQGKLFINSCTLAVSSKEMEDKEFRMFDQFKKGDCDCRIAEEPENGSGICTLASDAAVSSCQAEHAICAKLNDGCGWVFPLRYMQCLGQKRAEVTSVKAPVEPKVNLPEAIYEEIDESMVIDELEEAQAQWVQVVPVRRLVRYEVQEQGLYPIQSTRIHRLQTHQMYPVHLMEKISFYPAHQYEMYQRQNFQRHSGWNFRIPYARQYVPMW